MLLGRLMLRRNDYCGGGELLGGRGRGLGVVVEAERGHEFDEGGQCGHYSQLGRGGSGTGALGDLGNEGVMGSSLLKGWASSSVSRHSERWIAWGRDRDDKSMVGKTTPGRPCLFLPRPLCRSSLSLFPPSIMNQQQPAANSQSAASLYMGQRLEMEYLCAGAPSPHLFRVPYPIFSQTRLRCEK